MLNFYGMIMYMARKEVWALSLEILYGLQNVSDEWGGRGGTRNEEKDTCKQAAANMSD